MSYKHLAALRYGVRETKILRFNWLLDQLQKESLGAMIGERTNVWLLVSGNSPAMAFLEENGFSRRGTPTLFGHIWVLQYVAQRKGPIPAEGAA